MPAIVANYIRNPAAGGKFVILMPRDGGDGGIVVLSDFSRDCQHRDIVVRWEAGRKSGLAAEGFRVAGGGWWKFSPASCLLLYGQSGAYGRFDPAWLRQNLLPGMVGCETSVEVR